MITIENISIRVENTTGSGESYRVQLSNTARETQLSISAANSGSSMSAIIIGKSDLMTLSDLFGMIARE